MSVRNRMGVAFATLLLCLTALVGCATPTPAPTTSEGTPDPNATATASSGDTITLTMPSPLPTQPAPELSDAAVTTDSGLRYEDTAEGEGDGAALGDEVTVHYTGFLTNGTTFDSSRDGDPFLFTLGSGRVIKGWDEGLIGMKKGGKRILEIPADLAYGADGQPPMIPGGATLIFEVELVDVQSQQGPAEVSEYQRTENGVEYAILTEGSGEPIQKNDLVTFNFKAWRGDGLMFDSSDQAGRPAQFTLGSSGLAGLDEGMEGMLPGEKRQIKIPPEMAYGEEGAGEVIPPNDTIIFEVELVDAVAAPRLVIADDYTTTDSGLEYAILQEGTGDPAETGDGVSVHYSGYLEDGTMFDSSVQREEPFIFVLGQGNVIPGWDEGVVGMKKGEKRQLRIPADLAYGEAGSPPVIPPNATLIFDIELVEISPDAGAQQATPEAPALPPAVPTP